MKSIRVLVAAVGLVGALAIGRGALAEDPVKVRVGWITSPDHIAALIFSKPDVLQQAGLLKNYGKKYTVDLQKFQGTTNQIQALATNSLDIAVLAAVPLAQIVNDAHVDVKVVGDVFQDGVDGYYSFPFMVRNDGPIKTVQDLKGKKVAVNALGSSGDAVLRIFVHRAGLKDSDFTTIEAPVPAMAGMLKDGRADLVQAIPSTQRDFPPDQFHPLFRTQDVDKLRQPTFSVMRSEFITAHKEAMIDYYEDYIRAVRFFEDPNQRDKSIKIVNQVTNIPLEKLDFVLTKNDVRRDPDAKPVVESIQLAIDQVVSLGILKQGLTVAPKYVDLSIVEAAAKRVNGK